MSRSPANGGSPYERGRGSHQVCLGDEIEVFRQEPCCWSAPRNRRKARILIWRSDSSPETYRTGCPSAISRSSGASGWIFPIPGRRRSGRWSRDDSAAQHARKFSDGYRDTFFTVPFDIRKSLGDGKTAQAMHTGMTLGGLISSNILRPYCPRPRIGGSVPGLSATCGRILTDKQGLGLCHGLEPHCRQIRFGFWSPSLSFFRTISDFSASSSEVSTSTRMFWSSSNSLARRAIRKSVLDFLLDDPPERPCAHIRAISFLRQAGPKRLRWHAS